MFSVILPRFGKSPVVSIVDFRHWLNQHTASRIREGSGNHRHHIETPGAQRVIPFNEHRGGHVDPNAFAEFAKLLCMSSFQLMDLIYHNRGLPKGTGRRAQQQGLVAKPPLRKFWQTA